MLDYPPLVSSKTLSTEESVQQFVAADFLVGGNIGKDCGQGAHS